MDFTWARQRGYFPLPHLTRISIPTDYVTILISICTLNTMELKPYKCVTLCHATVREARAFASCLLHWNLLHAAKCGQEQCFLQLVMGGKSDPLGGSEVLEGVSETKLSLLRCL